ncbi:ROK family transcriptional regulator [Cryptosporangium aurantiacum]|uniref:Sugar kinase of the NBD/HSP70 family, may contain an N-terminal HTH domain n=1 Tax=Cryptosporangium aurantiacum TaxID=134849 RepID=A0A1M7NQ53_9ACTN|nr:ROK family transcriptional regulator [Cryptosporangium aurantiacum]SHN06084.1 Sugar kinase of the NBD/HSP70 family, may contain an N-terminal HTH domain [Cryptosporangium aurantiacum]
MSTSRASAGRWRGAAEIVDYVRRHPGATRAEVGRALGLSSGSTTEILVRLRASRLLDEVPSPTTGRGRPTTVLRPSAAGPLVLAAEIRHEDWRWCLVEVDGRLGTMHVGRHDGAEPDRVLADLRQSMRRAHTDRLVGVSLAVAATVRDGRLVQASTLGWGSVDVSGLTELPLTVGNDATLAGVAEARTGAAAGARTALHLTVEVGVGGTLTADGTPLTGAHGSAGEYGHLPLGDPSLRCPCGATGCWDLMVDGRALARHLGDPSPVDARSYAHRVLRSASSSSAASAAVSTVVTALARGVAGLVNAHDPDVVTLGGLAVPLRAAAPDAFETAYLDGLMAFRRSAPPPVSDSVHGDDGALHGAAAVGWDRVTGPEALADWADRAKG